MLFLISIDIISESAQPRVKKYMGAGFSTATTVYQILLHLVIRKLTGAECCADSHHCWSG
jgi:hypothetical protein